MEIKNLPNSDVVVKLVVFETFDEITTIEHSFHFPLKHYAL